MLIKWGSNLSFSNLSFYFLYLATKFLHLATFISLIFAKRWLGIFFNFEPWVPWSKSVKWVTKKLINGDICQSNNPVLTFLFLQHRWAIGRSIKVLKMASLFLPAQIQCTFSNGKRTCVMAQNKLSKETMSWTFKLYVNMLCALEQNGIPAGARQFFLHNLFYMCFWVWRYTKTLNNWSQETDSPEDTVFPCL